MNELSDWPDDDLRDCIMSQDQDVPTRCYRDETAPVSVSDALAELLRRERERCAKVCDQLADDDWATTESQDTAQSCAARIRGLQ